MEFLMTYGWALLIVLVALGALAFFGVFNFDNVLPEQCILGIGFACTTFSVHSTGDGTQQYINMQVANNLGQDLELFIVEVTKESETSGEVCGGFYGLIVDITTFPPFSLLFRQNDIRPIGSIGNFVVLPNLQCRETIPSQINCCDTIDLFLPLSAYFTPAPTNIEDCSDSITWLCNTPPSPTSPYVMKPGERFTADLTIYYKPVGSAIIHKRKQGSLAAYVNQI